MPMIVAERVFELEEIQQLARVDRQDLRHDAEADRQQLAAAAGQHALDRPLVRGLDRLGHQLGQRAEIGRCDGQRAGERP